MVQGGDLISKLCCDEPCAKDHVTNKCVLDAIDARKDSIHN